MIDAVARPWRERRDAASLNQKIRVLPVLSLLAAPGLAPQCSAAVLGSVATWVAGLSPLAMDAQRAAAIGAVEDLLPVLAANGGRQFG